MGSEMCIRDRLTSIDEYWIGDDSKYSMKTANKRELYLSRIRRDGGMGFFKSVVEERRRKLDAHDETQLFLIYMLQ